MSWRRSSVRCLVGLAALALMSIPSRAQAKCVGPSDTLFPKTGALPPNPTLYLFAIQEPTLEAPELVAETNGEVVPVDLQLVSQFAARRVFRVTVHLAEGPLSIRYSGHRTPATYTVGASLAPPATPPRLVAMSGHESSWTCANTDVVIVDTSIAAAGYEARFPDGLVVVVPPLAGLYGTRLDADEPSSSTVVLGEDGCLRHNIPPERMHQRLDVRLAALLPDGSRWELGPLRGTPVVEDPWSRKPRSPPWWVFLAFGVGAMAGVLARRALLASVLAPSHRSGDGHVRMGRIPVARVVRR